MQIFVKSLSGQTSVVNVQSSLTLVEEAKSMVAARVGIEASEQRLIFAGRELENGRSLGEFVVEEESTLHLVVSLDGGAKKRKKKVYTTPKVIPHKHKTIKLSVLKYYKVDDATGKVTRLKKECPNCGSGNFMANHFDRYYCGRCHVTFLQTEAKKPEAPAKKEKK